VVNSSPGKVVEAWIEAFNRRDIESLLTLYADNAITHQAPESFVTGKEALRSLYEELFASDAEMTCIPRNLIEQGDTVVLEWVDPNGLRGCSIYQVADGKIKFQRGYWDKLSFLRLQGLPLPGA
jgi:hypothetical protein